MGDDKPKISLPLGDPSGIGTELVARLLSDDEIVESADVYMIGSREEFLRGQEIAGVDVPFLETSSIEDADFSRGLPVLQDVPVDGGLVELGRVSASAGRHTLQALGIAIDLAAAGATDAVCFAPLNKDALHRGGNPFEDELHWIANRLGVDGYVCEVNAMDGIWTSRVSSHVPLREVSDLLSVDRIVSAVVLIDQTMREAGVEHPRIAVAGLNPHIGEGGLLGDEEIAIIGPAVAEARASVEVVDGPFSADTIFLKVRDGEYDAVVTMYHDQGQIALKLMGFDRAVSVQGGLPIPVTTPSHGTAHDIVGQGRADVSAVRRAFLLACEMGARRARPATTATGEAG